MELTSKPHCADCHAPGAPERSQQLKRALALEYLTVGWNVVEGVIAVTEAAVSGSVALMAFGIDSFVESTSGLVMVWRLRAERSGRHMSEAVEHLERRARRGVALSLFALAAYVSFDAIRSFWETERPQFSAVGVALTGVSILVMLWLARAKRRAARALQSRALEADAFQTTACWWLSIAALGGLALNGALGWWWADPAAALLIAALVAREGLEAWRGEDCC